MAIKNIIAKGVGFSPTSTKWIPTHGFTISAAIVAAAAIYPADTSMSRIGVADTGMSRIGVANTGMSRVGVADTGMSRKQS